jgi:PAS domain-containing protein
MKKNKAVSTKARTPREEAIQRLDAKGVTTEQWSDADARRLIEELRTHRIELEMQNEELRKARAELEESRGRYSNLYDFAPVGYFTFDQQGLILEANLTGATLLGIPRSALSKKPFVSFIVPEHQDAFHLHLRTVINRDPAELRNQADQK